MKKLQVLAIIIITGFVLVSFTVEPTNGKLLFEQHCAKCHGADGTRGKFGAANLQVSVLTQEAVIERIENGKKFMPPFRKRLDANQIRDLAGYVKTLRRN